MYMTRKQVYIYYLHYDIYYQHINYTYYIHVCGMCWFLFQSVIVTVLTTVMHVVQASSLLHDGNSIHYLSGFYLFHIPVLYHALSSVYI